MPFVKAFQFPAKFISEDFDKKQCGSNKIFLLIPRQYIMLTKSSEREKRRVPNKKKISEFMIHAANSVRIAIDAASFNVSLHHCLLRIP
jgi:hypothetical protein